MSLVFKRMYVDIPADTHDRLKMLAVERGMSQKGLLAKLIEQACEVKPVTKPRRKVTKKRPQARKPRRKTRGTKK